MTDITEPQLATGVVNPYYNLLDRRRVRRYALTAQAYITLQRFNTAARLIAQIVAQGGHDLLQRDVARGEHMRIDHRPDFPVAITGNGDAGDPIDLHHAPANLFGMFIQRGVGHFAVQAQTDHRKTRADARQFRLFRQLRQFGDAIQQGTRIAHEIVDIGAGLELDIDVREALATGRTHVVDVFVFAEFLLDGDSDLLFDLGRRGALELGLDMGHIQLHDREQLLRHGAPGQHADDQQQHQGQVDQ